MAARIATKRLLRELEAWQADARELAARKAAIAAEAETFADAASPSSKAARIAALDAHSALAGIERLGPVGDGDDLFRWEAVLNGSGVGGGYDAGRWRLEITVPAAYPNQPPVLRFATPLMHANVALNTGAVCLDLLQSAWTPTLTLAQCVAAVRSLLSTPGTDSPLNVDLAALLRAGDAVAAARLVRLWCEEHHYDGA